MGREKVVWDSKIAGVVDHDYHAHDNERDRAMWNSLKPAPLTEADFLGL
jgi:hypothetical protein